MHPTLVPFISALVLLSACGPRFPPMPPQRPELHKPPSDSEFASADFGNPPPAEDSNRQIRAAMAPILKDSESARYSFSSPARAWVPLYYVTERYDPDGGIHVGRLDGWKVKFTLNAKNSFGGYAGAQEYIAFFEGGKLACILQTSFRDIFGYEMSSVVWRSANK